MPRNNVVESIPEELGRAQSYPFRPRHVGGDPQVHVFGNGVVCDTDVRGYPTPDNRPVTELVLHAPQGFIPLWAQGVTLRWRFQERSFRFFEDPEAAKRGVESLLGEALLAWGDAAPVKFTKRETAWDFEIVVRDVDRCTIDGCVLASAFFPDAGRHELVIYPKMFTQNRVEQVETLVHEIGHTFGLRHFFANISETGTPSEVFGTHNPFTIMNYGNKSFLTDADKSDLKKLYREAWTGERKAINGTPVRLVKPFHAAGAQPDTIVAMEPAAAVVQPRAAVAYVRTA